MIFYVNSANQKVGIGCEGIKKAFRISEHFVNTVDRETLIDTDNDYKYQSYYLIHNIFFMRMMFISTQIKYQEFKRQVLSIFAHKKLKQVKNFNIKISLLLGGTR